jgi:hypothetical protein
VTVPFLHLARPIGFCSLRSPASGQLRPHSVALPARPRGSSFPASRGEALHCVFWYVSHLALAPPLNSRSWLDHGKSRNVFKVAAVKGLDSLQRRSRALSLRSADRTRRRHIWGGAAATPSILAPRVPVLPAHGEKSADQRAPSAHRRWLRHIGDDARCTAPSKTAMWRWLSVTIPCFAPVLQVEW